MPTLISPPIIPSETLNEAFGAAFSKYWDKELSIAEETLQDDLASELVTRLVEIVEKEAVIEHDQNEDGTFTTVVVDTPNTRELLKDAILDNYRLEKK